ncbi:TPA: hypothetical protein ACH3X1_011145 [Trebouxia sp. C0004]
MSSKSRVQLTDVDRKVICELAKSHAGLTHDKLTRLAAQQLGKPDLGRSTVIGTFKQSDKWLKVTPGTASKTVNHRGAQHAKLEQALYAWFGKATARGAAIVDRLIVEKAKDVAEELKIDNFKVSDGWLAGFKSRKHNLSNTAIFWNTAEPLHLVSERTQRESNWRPENLKYDVLLLEQPVPASETICHKGYAADVMYAISGRLVTRHGIKLQRPKGESGSADMEGVNIARTVVGKIITELDYDLEDIYNMDETGLYYRAKPSKTLAVGKDISLLRPMKSALELSELINSLNSGPDALTAKEYEQFPGEQEVERELTTAELVALVSDEPETSEMADDVDSSDEVEEVVTAPSLSDARQHLKGLAAFLTDNPQFSAADEMAVQRLSDKVAKMLVSRVNHRRQQSITSYFTAA